MKFPYGLKRRHACRTMKFLWQIFVLATVILHFASATILPEIPGFAISRGELKESPVLEDHADAGAGILGKSKLNSINGKVKTFNINRHAQISVAARKRNVIKYYIKTFFNPPVQETIKPSVSASLERLLKKYGLEYWNSGTMTTECLFEAVVDQLRVCNYYPQSKLPLSSYDEAAFYAEQSWLIRLMVVDEISLNVQHYILDIFGQRLDETDGGSDGIEDFESKTELEDYYDDNARIPDFLKSYLQRLSSPAGTSIESYADAVCLAALSRIFNVPINVLIEIRHGELDRFQSLPHWNDHDGRAPHQIGDNADTASLSSSSSSLTSMDNGSSNAFFQDALESESKSEDSITNDEINVAPTPAEQLKAGGRSNAISLALSLTGKHYLSVRTPYSYTSL